MDVASRWRATGAALAGVTGVIALGVGVVAAWTSVSLLLGEEPASDPAWGDFVGGVLAPVALIALVLGAGLLHVARRNWRLRKGERA